VLDKIYDYGPTELFQEIAAHALNKLEMDVHLVHTDTTSVSVSGNYEMEDGTDGFKITFGHSKDHRQDLKQFVIGMVVVRLRNCVNSNGWKLIEIMPNQQFRS